MAAHLPVRRRHRGARRRRRLRRARRRRALVRTAGLIAVLTALAVTGMCAAAQLPA